MGSICSDVPTSPHGGQYSKAPMTATRGLGFDFHSKEVCAEVRPPPVKCMFLVQESGGNRIAIHSTSTWVPPPGAGTRDADPRSNRDQRETTRWRNTARFSANFACDRAAAR